MAVAKHWTACSWSGCGRTVKYEECLYERPERCGRLSRGEDDPLAFTMMNIAIRCEGIAHPLPFLVA